MSGEDKIKRLSDNGRKLDRKHGSSMGPEYNIALLGALGVGKSAMTVKYITKRFIMEYDPFLEGTYTKTEYIDGQLSTVRVMDTVDKDGCSPERYLQWACGFIVVYSITNRPSLDTAQALLEGIAEYQRLTGKDRPVALVGNKMDLERYRTVSTGAGKALAAQFECSFYETSAAEDFPSVQQVFHDTIRDISRMSELQTPLQPLFISEEKTGPGTNVVTRTHQAVRRTRTPKSFDSKDSKDREPRTTHKRSTSTFKLFNKSFKIFN